MKRMPFKRPTGDTSSHGVLETELYRAVDTDYLLDCTLPLPWTSLHQVRCGEVLVTSTLSAEQTKCPTSTRAKNILFRR